MPRDLWGKAGVLCLYEPGHLHWSDNGRHLSASVLALWSVRRVTRDHSSALHTSASRRLHVCHISHLKVANSLNYKRRTNIPSWRYSYFYAYILVKFSEGHPTALAPGLLSGVGGLGLAV